jgi:hypothetical protein
VLTTALDRLLLKTVLSDRYVHVELAQGRRVCPGEPRSVQRARHWATSRRGPRGAKRNLAPLFLRP